MNNNSQSNNLNKQTNYSEKIERNVYSHDT